MNIIGWFDTNPVKIGFEKVKAIRPDVLLINTLPAGEQQCLIRGTLAADQEEAVLNRCISKFEAYKTRIIVYGKNAADETAYEKCRQLRKLGFREVSLYAGGFFEWLLLQDVYGATEFHTTSKCSDMLRYR